MIKKIHNTNMYSKQEAIDVVTEFNQANTVRLGIRTTFGIMFIDTYSTVDLINRCEKYIYISLASIKTDCCVIQCLLLERPVNEHDIVDMEMDGRLIQTPYNVTTNVV